MGIGDIWNLIAMRPMINILIVLCHYLFDNFGIAIIVMTVIIRGAMYPVTMKQLRSTKSMQSLQPKLAELQKKYGKDKQRLSQEQMKLYKESGMSPAGCLGPMVIQMPIWIALFWSVMKVLAVTPEDFLSLSQYLYSWSVVYYMLPLGEDFLWLNLAKGDVVLAVLVGGTMWVQQKMMMASSADPKQQAQSRMMLWMMPMMFGFFCLTFPSGLSLYWLTSNIISIVMQYFITGWGGLVPTPTYKQRVRDSRYKKRIAQQGASLKESDISADIVDTGSAGEEVSYGDKRQDSGGGYSKRSYTIRRQSGRSKHYRPKGR
ncbi:YidC/Oxa1 family membrane protein insertase [Chloroflexota bacterium]